MSGPIFTIGHSTRPLKDFVGLLRDHGVDVLVDVRRFPRSGRHPHFDREALAPALRSAGIRYLWLGEYLGGYRPGGYQRWMAGQQFRRGLEFIESIAARRRVAIMCAEKLFFRCHRRFIADALVARGWHVLHIIDPGRSQVHRPSPPHGRLDLG